MASYSLIPPNLRMFVQAERPLGAAFGDVE